MSFNQIKLSFRDAVFYVASHIDSYSVHSGIDLSRRRKLPPDTLISFLVSQGASSTDNELLDFFDFSPSLPSPSALNQQRDKLKPEALEEVFHLLNQSAPLSPMFSQYRFLAADGSTCSFFSKCSLASQDYFVSEGHSSKGFYSIHLNALYDLSSHTYVDAVLQPIHHKDEFRAFCDMVDRQDIPDSTSYVYIGDRGYCSYNDMAHVLDKHQFFLFRAKDVSVRGMTQHLPVPKEGVFDLWLDIAIKRSHSRNVVPSGDYITFVDAKTSFDFLPYGSLDTYTLPLRIIRLLLPNGSYECLLTNLPSDEFPPSIIEQIYFARWGVESAFRKLKYTIGLSSFHSYKPEFIKQEIWAKLIAYNLTELLINNTVIEKREHTKHSYKVNFSVAAHICRVFLRLNSNKNPENVMNLLKRKLIPIRNDRIYPRLNTAHFRRPKYFLYRAA